MWIKNQDRQVGCMKKKIRVFGIVIAAAFWIACPGLTACAEEKAEFRVQAAEVAGDGTMSVSVYLTGTSNLGGVDVDVVYDPAKVRYISSRLGEGFSDGYGETHCIEQSSLIRCAVIYAGRKEAHGELINVKFQLNEGKAYQPELRVREVLDASNEVKDIPYTIVYQQSDGNWNMKQDTSGKKADKSIIMKEKEAYGIQEVGNEKLQEENRQTETVLEIDDIEKSEQAEERKTMEGKENNMEQENGKSNVQMEVIKGNWINAAMVGGVVFTCLGLGLYYGRRRKKKYDNQ